MHLGHGPPSRRRRPALVGAIPALFVALFAALSGASPASAHTDLEYTVPADQEQVVEPVTQITVAFSDPVTLVGAGFEVFTPQEQIVQPSVFTEDNMVFLLQLDAPLVGGEAGVRYEVTAADGHLLDGGFRFTVPAAVPATVTPTPPSPPAPPASEPVAGSTVVPAAGTTAPVIIAPAPTASPSPTLDTAVADAAVADTAVAVAADADDDDGGTSTGLIVGVVAALALGVVAFVVLRSRTARAT